MPPSSPFVTKETYARKIKDPETGEATWEVDFRVLSGGDRAKLLDAVRIDSVGEVGQTTELRMGLMQTLTIEAAVVAWRGPGFDETPITRQTIADLHPAVYEQIFELASFGTPPPEDMESDTTAAVVAVADDASPGTKDDSDPLAVDELERSFERVHAA